MKKFLKKSVAIILTLAMLFSLNVSVFATDNDALVDYQELYVGGESAYAYVSGMTDSDWFKFTPETDGKYVFESETIDIWTTAILYDDPNNDPIAHSNGGFFGGEGAFKIVADLTAGETYYLEVGVGSDFSTTFPVSVRLSPISDVQFETIELYETDSTKITDSEGNEYYHYNWSDKLNYYVTMEDGDLIQDSNLEFWYIDRWYKFEYTDFDQGAHNQWQVGATYSTEFTVDGVTSNLYVHINESPIESISVEPVNLYENYGGDYCEGWDDETQSNKEYYRYNWWDRLRYTITMKDGQVISGTGCGFNYNDEYHSFELNDDQAYQNQWDIGTHNVSISALGYTAELTANVTETPVESISFEPITLVKNYGGDYCEGWDDETESYKEYYRYYWWSRLRYTITMKDGQVITGNGDGFDYDGEYYLLEYEDDQAYQNQWDIGTHNVTISALGYTSDFSITLTESPVESVSFEPITFIENYGGDYNEGWDDETESYKEYYRYYWWNNLKYTITMNDGQVITGTGDGFEYNGEYYPFEHEDDQSYQNKWGVGTHNVTISTFDYAVNHTVTIAETPIESISFEPITFIENYNGDYCEDWDDETESYKEYYRYDWWNKLKYTVTLKGGETLQSDEDGCIYYNGERYYCNYNDTQSFKNPWGVGNYSGEINILGYKANVSVEIIDTPIESISFDPVSIIENTNCYTCYDWNQETEESDLAYNYYDWNEYDLLKYTITMKDGQVINGSGEDFEYDGEYYWLQCNDGQGYQKEWGVGTHNVTISVLGYTANHTVTITESPVAKIEIDPISIIEGTNCEYQNDYNPDTDEWDREYLEYRWTDKVQGTLTMKNGKVYEINNGYIETGDEETFDITFSANQGYSNQWTAGNTYTATVKIDGAKAEVPVTITPSPVVSITVDPIVIAEGKYCDQSSQYNPETGEWDLYYNHYWWRNLLNYTITFNDGTQITGSNGSFSYKDEWYEVITEELSPQSYENEWVAGGVYTIAVSTLGKTAESTVSILNQHTDGDYTYLIQGDGAIIIDCSSDEKVVTVPTAIGDYTVIGITGLGCGAEEIIIPDGITSISDEIFYDCYNLKKVTIGADVLLLRNSMFNCCPSLEQIVVSQNNPYYTSVDGIVYNKDVTKMLAIPRAKTTAHVVPETVTDINLFFNGSYNFTIDLGNSDTGFVQEDGIIYSDDKTTIYSCDSNKTGKYDMPDTVTTIGNMAFQNSNLTEVIVSDNITDIVYYAFAGSINLEKVILPENLQSISTGAFRGCEKLEDVNIPSNLKNLGEHAFDGSGIKTAVIPASVKTISYKAFYNSALTNLTLNEGLQEIEHSAFAESKVNSVTLPNSLNYMNSSAFANTPLTSLTIGTGLESISSFAFENTKLTSVVIPENIQYIDECAFANSKIENVDFKNNNIDIWERAFYNCPIKQLNLNEGMTRIGRYAFYGIAATEVDIPESVTTITYKSFADSKNLAKIDISDNIQSLDGYAFDGTAWYESQKDGMVYLEKSAYHYKGKMPKNTRVIIKDGTKLIANYAFDEQINLKSIAIPESVTNINDTALFNCPNVTIYGYKDSSAETYAKENGIPFIDINDKSQNICEYDNACDTTCNICGLTRTIKHSYAAATCKAPKTCKVCGVTTGSKLSHKSDKGTITKNATCKATGTKTYKCTLCKATIKTESIAKVAHSYASATCTKAKTCKVCGVTSGKALGHNYTTTTTKATLSKNGKVVNSCSRCDKVASTTTIKYVKSFKLSTTSYTYNGKVKTPSVTVKDSAGKTLKKNTDYTVSYASGRKNVGTYKVTIKMKGKYSGTKTLTFKINPAGTTVSKLTAGKKSITVNISKKSTQVSGYEVQYSTSKKFTSAKTKTISSYKTTKYTLKSLSAKKTYYVRVRTYKTVSGKKYYSGWSTVKSVKTK
ncbi:MAG: leucine-rich repeat protein [Clostridia bacterium]|nr:leucine-rich repeat protein [Clostridia bacterium]